MPLCRREAGLGRGRPHAPQRGHHRDADVPREIDRLIEAAVPAPRRVERHRDRAGGAVEQTPRRAGASAPPSGRASDRRPSYLSAWTMARRRAVVGADCPPAIDEARRPAAARALFERHAHRAPGRQRVAAAAAERRRQRQDGAPAVASQTGPCVGRSRGWSQAAQAGARMTLRRASSAVVSRQSPVISRSSPVGRSESSVHPADVRSAARGDLDALGVAPQAFEAVEDPRLGREHVDDEVEVVEENPFRAVVAFDVRRLDPSAASASITPSAIARTCRVFVPDAITKKSVKPGGLAQVQHHAGPPPSCLPRRRSPDRFAKEAAALSAACQS